MDEITEVDKLACDLVCLDNDLQRLKVINEGLRSVIEKLKRVKNFGEMSEALETVTAENERLKTENQRLRFTIEARTLYNKHLKEQVEKLKVTKEKKKPGRKAYGLGYGEPRVLELIHDWWLDNKTGEEIAQELNRRSHHYQRRCGKPWTRQAVYNIVSRHREVWLALTGDLRTKYQVVKPRP